MSREYPILCPNCKKGYMKFEWHRLYLKADYFWVCEYCRFTLDKDFDNPSRRDN
jgi:ssDNA-binding Zn-finger/Zn-ribbon topoisomerase 1